MWLVLTLIVLALLCYKVVQVHRYWEKRGVKQDGVFNIFSGIATLLFTRKYSILELVEMAYTRFPECSVYGAYNFGNPMLVIKDPEIIRQITVKDFNNFMDHGNVFGGDEEPMWGRNLISLKGERWRYMRSTLSPSFTSIKMKAMFNLMSDCASQVTRFFEDKNEKVSIVELKDVFSRYANDVIATCSFGIEVDSLRNRNNEFFRMGSEITKLSGFRNLLRFVAMTVSPKWSKKLGIKFIQDDVAKFFKDLVSETIKLREDKGVSRPDMLQLLMEARKGTLKYEESHHDSKATGFATVEESDLGKSLDTIDKEITLDDMTAQALIFFFAGFETVSTLMCFMAYELAIDDGIQDKLILEVDKTRLECGGVLTYEGLSRMKYLDMIISETLRKWPPGIALDRMCLQNYTMKTPQGDLEVPKGTMMWMPVLGLHHDSKYYPEPKRFDPERFSDENKSLIDPKTYYPFGIGPRSCIGSRFALLETKILFCHLLSKFRLVVVGKTPVPLKLTKSAFQLQAEGGFWLGLERRREEASS